MLHRFPKNSRPFDVVVTVEVAAADRVGGELKPPKNKRDRERADYKLNDSDGSFGVELGVTHSCSIKSSRARGSIGLVMWGLKPAWVERSLSSNIEYPVTATIGVVS